MKNKNKNKKKKEQSSALGTPNNLHSRRGKEQWRTVDVDNDRTCTCTSSGTGLLRLHSARPGLIGHGLRFGSIHWTLRVPRRLLRVSEMSMSAPPSPSPAFL